MEDLVFLLDVDNTFLDNDRIKEDIDAALIKSIGKFEAEEFWWHHDIFREEYNVVDFPNTIRKYCVTKDNRKKCESDLKKMFRSIKFTHALYPHAHAVLTHLKTIGTVVLFSEGDSVYQQTKIEESGLEERVDSLHLYQDKVSHLLELRRTYWGKKMIFIDDKAEKLSAIKKQFPDIMSIHVRQGHYGNEKLVPEDKPDISIARIGNLLKFSKDNFIV